MRSMAGRMSPLATSLRRLSTTPAIRTLPSYRTSISSLQLKNPSRIVLRSASQWGRPQYNRFAGAQRAYGLWNQSPAFRLGLGVTVVGGVAFYYANLEQVPVSGRWRFNCVSPQTEAELSSGEMQSIMKQFRGKMLPPHHPYSVMAQKVLDRLIPAAGPTRNEWELHVIDEPKIMNAFVLPGGKVFVFSGLLPLCGGESGLAAVLGHEIAHNIAHHAAERMSSMWFLIGVAFVLSFAFDISGQLAHFAVDLALTKPNSRKQESEADFIGLMMMAQACYNPEEAIGFWQRMAKAEQYSPPQFLSTHPSSGNRVKRIAEWVSEANAKRSESGCEMISSQFPQFQQAFREVRGQPPEPSFYG